VVDRPKVASAKHHHHVQRQISVPNTTQVIHMPLLSNHPSFADTTHTYTHTTKQISPISHTRPIKTILLYTPTGVAVTRHSRGMDFFFCLFFSSFRANDFPVRFVSFHTGTTAQLCFFLSNKNFFDSAYLRESPVFKFCGLAECVCVNNDGKCPNSLFFSSCFACSILRFGQRGL